MKWCRKALLSYSKLSTDDVGNLVNHSFAAPLRVVGKERQYFVRGLLEAQRRLESVKVILRVLEPVK